MMATSKQAVSSYKLPRNNKQNLLQPTKSLRREPSDWETCGMNERNCLVWVEIVTRTDHADIRTCFDSVLFETVLGRAWASQHCAAADRDSATNSGCGDLTCDDTNP